MSCYQLRLPMCLFACFIMFLCAGNALTLDENEYEAEAMGPKPVAWFKTNCVKFNESFAPGTKSTCTINTFSYLGDVSGTRIYYVLYKYRILYKDMENRSEDGFGGVSEYLKHEPYCNTGVAILQGKDDVVPVLGLASDEFGLYWYDTPRLYKKDIGDVLYLPKGVSGTGGERLDRYFVYRGGKWEQIDTLSWEKQITLEIPGDCRIRKGFVIDLDTMQAESWVWKENDSNAGHTGGKIQWEFAFEGLQLKVKSFTYDPTAVEIE